MWIGRASLVSKEHGLAAAGAVARHGSGRHQLRLLLLLLLLRVPRELVVRLTVEDLVHHAKEVALLEHDVASDAAEAVDVEEAMPCLHD